MTLERKPIIADAILVRESKVLLALRAPHRKAFPNCWDAVGGHLERDETCDAALARELSEELGVTPVEAEVLGDYPALRGTWLRLYRVDAWKGGEPKINNDEHTDLRWFGCEEVARLPNLAFPYYAELFRTLLRGAR